MYCCPLLQCVHPKLVLEARQELRLLYVPESCDLEALVLLAVFQFNPTSSYGQLPA